jgi:hypothetical protein
LDLPANISSVTVEEPSAAKAPEEGYEEEDHSVPESKQAVTLEPPLPPVMEPKEPAVEPVPELISQDASSEEGLAEQILLEQMASEAATDEPADMTAPQPVVARMKGGLAVPSHRTGPSWVKGALVQILIVLLALLAAGMIAYLTGILSF